MPAGERRQIEEQQTEPEGRRMDWREAEDRLRRRRNRGRRLAAAAALVVGGAALLFWPVRWGGYIYAVLLGLALLLAASLLAGRMTEDGGTLDEEVRRELAVRRQQFRRLGDWLVGIGVVLLVNGLLMLTLMREDGTQWALVLGMIQAGLGCFLCLEMWTTVRAYRWMLRD